MTRIKTLAELSEQYDRISDYLTQRGRYGAACKVDAIYKRMFNRIFELIGITESMMRRSRWFSTSLY